MRGLFGPMLVVSAAVAGPAPAQTGGQASDPHWIRDADSGCRIHNPSPKPGERVRWTGERCSAGQAAAGWGSLIWSDGGGALEEVGFGELVAGVMERQWLTCYPNGRMSWRIMTGGTATRTLRIDDTSGWTRTDVGGCAVGSNNTAYAGARFPGPAAASVAAAAPPPSSPPPTRPATYVADERGCRFPAALVPQGGSIAWSGSCYGYAASGNGTLTIRDSGYRIVAMRSGYMQNGEPRGSWTVCNPAQSEFACTPYPPGRRPADAASGAGPSRESLADALARSAEERRRHNEEVNRQNCARQSKGATIACTR